jgi:hypothetical protein
MVEESDISKLLRLKRYEQPPPGYFDDFMHEFRRRQRADLLQRPTFEILWDRILSIAPTFRVPQLAYAAIVALALSASVFIVNQKPAHGVAVAAANTDALPAFSLTTSKPVTISDTLPAAAQVGGSVPSHYVLQSRPVSNEQPLSF